MIALNINFLPMTDYLSSVLKQFTYYKQLADKTVEQVPEEKLFWQFNPESNSMATVMKHLAGNMLSRWTDFLTTDGEKDFRKRDAEFLNDMPDKQAVLEYWEKGWTCLFQALEGLNEEHLQQIVYIRNMGHTVVEAINRQLAHYAYHVGQMVFLGKIIQDEAWDSLSIPRGKSDQYNAEKFNKEKRREHFTDDL